MLQESHYNLNTDHEDLGKAQPHRHSSVTTVIAQMYYHTLGHSRLLVRIISQSNRSIHSLMVAKRIVSTRVDSCRSREGEGANVEKFNTRDLEELWA